MKRVLLTGMSGTGKSTMILELRRRGHEAIDLDDPAWSRTAPDGEWVWQEDRVATLLAAEDGTVLFVAGCASNQATFHHLFDHIILLTAPVAVLKERLANRTNNAFGKSPEELAKILRDVEETQPKLRRLATLEIDTRKRVDEVVESILREVGAGGLDSAE